MLAVAESNGLFGAISWSLKVFIAPLSMVIIVGVDKNLKSLLLDYTIAAGGASRIATAIRELKKSGSREPPAMICVVPSEWPM